MSVLLGGPDAPQIEGREATPLLQAEELTVTFRAGRRRLVAVDGVDLSIYPNETVAVVGESGSGKSTIARTLIRALQPDRGRISFDGVDITHSKERALRPIRRRMQMVQQDPYASLDPRMTVGKIVAQPLRVQGRASAEQIRAQVEEMITEVGLDKEALSRLPAQFSGGQRQRISIARSLVLKPDVLIADEPLSALDVSVQAQLINLLRDLQARHNTAYLFISHDLALVRQIADRMVVVYLGRVVEEGAARDVFAHPQHPYTAALLSAAPARRGAGGGERIVLKGEAPSAVDRPSGCHFHPRCPIARPRCAAERPPVQVMANGQRAACFYPGELGAVQSSGAVISAPAASRAAPSSGTRDRGSDATSGAPSDATVDQVPRSGRSVLSAISRHVAGRVVQLAITLFAVTTVLFFLLHLTGDPAQVIAGQNATPEQLVAIRKENGLDQPLISQYFHFLAKMFSLDFGNSYLTGTSALHHVLQRLGPTIGLTVAAMALNLVVSTIIGCVIGARQGSRLSRILSFLVFVAQGVPFYVLGLVLIQIFTVTLHLLPSLGDSEAKAWILPSATLAWFLAPRLTRVIAVNVTTAMGQDYMRVVRASGASRLWGVLRHALPNAMMAAASLAATQFAYLLSGTVIVEQIFGWPGIGQLLIGSITNTDFPVVLASVFFIAVFVYAINAATDVALTLIDPRTRQS